MIVAFWKVRGTFMLTENQKYLGTRSIALRTTCIPIIPKSIICTSWFIFNSGLTCTWLPSPWKNMTFPKGNAVGNLVGEKTNFYLTICIYFYEYWSNTRLFLLMIREIKMRSECRTKFFLQDGRGGFNLKCCL